LNLSYHGFRGPPPARLLRASELGLAAVIAAEVGLLAWVFAAPPSRDAGPVPVVRPSAPPDLSILGRFDPFFRRGEAASELASAGGGSGPANAVLYGVRAGGRGSAILAVGGGAQQIYDVGDEVAPGLILAAVGSDHVILARGGARLTLGFPTPAAGAAPATDVSPPLPASDLAAPGAVDPRRLLEESSLMPRLLDGEPSGYRVMAPAATPALAAAGLQRGDVLLAVDGVGLTPERVAELPQTLAGASEVELRFERDGQVVTKRVRMEAR
jgi:general secretion pathway protein C